MLALLANEMKFAPTKNYAPQEAMLLRCISSFLSISIANGEFQLPKANFIANNLTANYLLASSTATAQATLIPTMGLLPIRGSKFLL